MIIDGVEPTVMDCILSRQSQSIELAIALEIQFRGHFGSILDKKDS
jgi:hypothetical protein